MKTELINIKHAQINDFISNKKRTVTTDEMMKKT